MAAADPTESNKPATTTAHHSSSGSEAKPTSTTKKAPSAAITTTTKETAVAVPSSSTTLSFSNYASQSIMAFPDDTSTALPSTTPPLYHYSNIQPQSTTAQDTPSSATLTPATNAADAAASHSSGGSGLSGGAVGGIVVAVVGASAAALFAFMFLRRRRTKRSRDISSGRLSSFGRHSEFFSAPPQSNPMTDTAATTGAYYHHQQPYQQPYQSHQAQPTAPNMMASYGTTYVPPPVDSYTYQQNQQTSYYAPQLQLQHLDQPHSPPLSAPSLAVAAAAAAAATSTTQSPSEPDPWQQTPIGTYTVVSTYTPTLDDELYVQLGDRVQVFVQYDDGWCLGANLSANGARGVFPQHCVQQPSPQQPFAQTLAPSDNRYSKRSSSLMNESPVK